MRRRLFVVFAALATAFTMLPAGAQVPDRTTDRELPASVADARLGTPVQSSFEPADLEVLLGRTGPQHLLVRLKDPSIAESGLRGAAAANARKELRRGQDSLLGRILRADPNAEILGSVQIVMNAIFLEVDASAIGQLLDDPAVTRVVPVANYELELEETVPHIGAAFVQDELEFDGTGVRIAVLDSGVDYTHANLGGPGTLDAYHAAYGDSTLSGKNRKTNDRYKGQLLFPTAKVVGGYDFVGEQWPNGHPVGLGGGNGVLPRLKPDPDPIDFEGHGTHVADIIGGVNGVAPGAEIYAVKVCSAVSTACSGMALIQGMEFALDPNGDADTSDAVDIINMSLGASYGQPFDDDLSYVVDMATSIGVLTVAAAGNAADKPFASGTPAAAPTALSVAQTQVPSASLQLITVNSVDYPAVFQPWSVAPTDVVSGSLQYGDGAGDNLNGCAPFAADSLAGKVVLVDRGACNFTLKISNISQAGGAVGIIGLIAPGAPFSGGDGGDRPIDIPGYMISQADSNALKALVGETVTVDPGNQLPLVGQMVGSSSRGPQHEDTHLIKPEIGAPGASVSAIAGSGAGEGPFGGTSGASPMVAGAAALLLQAAPGLSPLEAKALLMNTGDTDIDTDPFTGLAPITRIGGGEVRIDRAVQSPAAAWEEGGTQGALSFGFVEVTDSVEMTKTVRVRNYSGETIEYSISPTFRYESDVLNGAVSVEAPPSVLVPANRDATFDVTLTIDGELLRGNYMNSGSRGANPATLTINEYDGYLMLDDGEHPIHMAWHVLPRKAAEVVPDTTVLAGGGLELIGLDNQGVGTAQNDAFALLAVSDAQPEGPEGGQAPTPDIRAVGVNTFPVPGGVCLEDPSFIWAFAINTWERQQHLLPVSHQVWLDTNQDGASDYVVLNRDVTFSDLTDGRQLSWVVDLATGTAEAFFFAEHATNTGNTVLYICGEQVGLTAADMLATNVDAFVIAQDWYYGGPGDLIDGLTITPLGEQFVAFDLDSFTFGVPDIPGLSTGSLGVLDFGPWPGNSPELGLMLFTNGDRGEGARGGATQDTEALLFLVD